MTDGKTQLNSLFDDKLLTDLNLLTGLVDKMGFQEQVLKVLAHAGNIGDFVVYTFTEFNAPNPKFSIGAGDLSDHTINRNVSDLDGEPAYIDFMKYLVDLQKNKIGEVIRFRPDQSIDGEILKIYNRSKYVEKLYTIHFIDDLAYYINYFRPIKYGEFSNLEIERLNRLIPILDNLIILRHKVVGIDDHQMQIRRGIIKSLNARKILPFDKLSKREVEVCDCIVKGLSMEGITLELGISNSSVKTMRQRAYKKMSITSKSELFAILLNIHF
jgi:DNA-binding CsgD family transcriptional regulator